MTASCSTAAESARVSVRFLLPPDDGSAFLVWKFAELFISKMHYLQNYLGLLPDAEFFGMPDAHPLRKKEDWDAALPYGGAVRWNSGMNKFFPLQAKPNCCGMYVARIDEPQPEYLREALRDLNADPPVIDLDGDAITAVIDICSGNHFVNIYQEQYTGLWFAIVHCDTPELKGGDQDHMGLYHDRPNPLLARSMNVLDTPWGPFQYVVDDACDLYLDRCRHAALFAGSKRKMIAERLFGEHTTVFADTHQAVAPGFGFTLGCYVLARSSSPIIPITVAPGEDAFLVEPGHASLDDEWYILPHGTGVLFPSIVGVRSVFYDRERPGVTAEVVDERGAISEITGVAEAPRDFKDARGVMELEELGVLEDVRRLEFRYGIYHGSEI